MNIKLTEHDTYLNNKRHILNVGSFHEREDMKGPPCADDSLIKTYIPHDYGSIFEMLVILDLLRRKHTKC